MNKEKPEIPIFYRHIGRSAFPPSLEQRLTALKFPPLYELQENILTYFFGIDNTNLLISAPNKSGKTCALLLGISEVLMQNKEKCLRAVLVYHTCEYAFRAGELAQRILAKSEVSVSVAVKGKCPTKSEKIAANILITTADKLADLCRSSSVSLDRVKFLVLEDAHNVVESLLKPSLALFSTSCLKIITTYSINNALGNFVEMCMLPCVKIERRLDRKAYNEVFVVYEEVEEKFDALLHLISRTSTKDQIVVFCVTKDTIGKLQNELNKNCCQVSSLCGGKGGMKAPEREIVLTKFKNKEIRILLTTGSFANAIESKGVRIVINFDFLYTFQYECNTDTYRERGSCLLGGANDGLQVNFIEKGWGNYIFQKVITAEGRRRFYEGIEIISVSEIKSLKL